jgi:hypothetical protein
MLWCLSQRHTFSSQKLPAQSILLTWSRNIDNWSTCRRCAIRHILQWARSMRRWFVPFLLLKLVLHVTCVPERNEEHERTDANCDGSAAGKHPAETFDFRTRVRVKRDGNFVVEFLDL